MCFWRPCCYTAAGCSHCCDCGFHPKVKKEGTVKLLLISMESKLD